LNDRDEIWYAYLKRIAVGDSEALGSLYQDTGTVLYSMALRMLNNPADAEEVVLEVFEQVWRTAERYDPTRSRVLWWLSMQIRSRALDRLRSSKRRQEMEMPIPETFDPAGVDPAPDHLVSFREDQRRVRTALAGLPAEQRQALELAYFLGMSHAEIAERLGAPLGTIKSRIRGALQVLRGALGDRGGTAAGRTA
jgi:RNA polymerase sigma-70 factor (ECF subfamily)